MIRMLLATKPEFIPNTVIRVGDFYYKVLGSEVSDDVRSIYHLELVPNQGYWRSRKKC